MDSNELKKLSLIIIKNFVNELGFDGDYYASINNYPIMYGKVAEGKFYTARSKELANLLSHPNNIEKDIKKKLFNTGLILINEKYKNKTIDIQSLSTVIHEMFHSKRMLLVNTQYGNDKDYPSVFSKDNHFVQNNDSNEDYYIDASQDIIKGSIDDSRKEILKFKNMNDKEKESLYWQDDRYDDKLEQQIRVDEALVELMTIVSCKLYKDKMNGIDSDIFSILKKISNSHLEEDLKAISNIMLRHNDLDLFRWMIDPLYYEQGYVNYDFFSNYVTSEDIEDVNKIKNFEFDDLDEKRATL